MNITNYIKERIEIYQEISLTNPKAVEAIIAELQAVLSKIEEL